MAPAFTNPINLLSSNVNPPMLPVLAVKSPTICNCVPFQCNLFAPEPDKKNCPLESKNAFKVPDEAYPNAVSLINKPVPLGLVLLIILPVVGSITLFSDALINNEADVACNEAVVASNEAVVVFIISCLACNDAVSACNEAVVASNEAVVVFIISCLLSNTTLAASNEAVVASNEAVVASNDAVVVFIISCLLSNTTLAASNEAVVDSKEAVANFNEAVSA